MLEELLGPCEFENHGERVLAGQRLMQATSDILLGWVHVESAIASYLGKSTTFDRAIVEFSRAYAEQKQRDYRELLAAVESGRITAETGL